MTLIQDRVGIRWYRSWAIHIEAAGEPHAGQYVGGERSE